MPVSQLRVKFVVLFLKLSAMVSIYVSQGVNFKVFYLLLYSIALRTLSLSPVDMYLLYAQSTSVCVT